MRPRIPHSHDSGRKYVAANNSSRTIREGKTVEKSEESAADQTYNYSNVSRGGLANDTISDERPYDLGGLTSIVL